MKIKLYYFLLLFLIISCKKKKQDIDPVKTWHKVADADAYNGCVYKDNLYLLSNYLYKIDNYGNVVEKQDVKDGNYFKGPLLGRNFYITTEHIEGDTFNIHFNSLTNPQSKFSAKNSTFKTSDSSFIKAGVFSMNMDSTSTNAILAYTSFDYGVTFFFSLFLLDINVDDVTGNITNVTVNKRITIDSIHDLLTNVYVFKNKYIINSTSNNTYIVYPNGTVNLLMNDIITPEFVLQDTLYAQVGSYLYKSGDGENWIKVCILDLSIDNVSIINNNIVVNYGWSFEKYDIHSNTFKNLNKDGIPNWSSNLIIQFGDYVYISTDVGLYRKKVNNFFE